MELQFQKSPISCVATLLDNHREAEQTLELKLPEGMADVGTVLGAWGQTVVRGKEWSAGSVGVSGGVMAWVLYMPEDGASPLCVEGWLPFQCRWDIPPTDRDGQIWVDAQLRCVDARCVSSRKLLVRSVVGLHVMALGEETYPIYTPEQVPEDVHLRKEQYMVNLPTEAGEKSFAIEEVQELSGGKEVPEKLICLRAHPELVDQKIIGSRMVFRGSFLVSGLCVGAEGVMWPLELELPFSQYTELENDHEENAQAHVCIAITGLEVDPDPSGIKVKAGMTAQYTVYDCPVLELVTDAYSTCREVKPMMESLTLPAVLDRAEQRLQATGGLPEDCDRVVDGIFYREPVEKQSEEGTVTAALAGKFQVLYCRADGSWGCSSCRWEDTVSLPAAESVNTDFCLVPTGNCQHSAGIVKADLRLMHQCQAGEAMELAVGLELGEATAPDAGRPTLILRTCGEQSLWELAKATGSTVERIQKANSLTGDPAPDKMLLIPVV